MPTPTPPLGRFQFTLGRILWTMFVCSVTAAIVRTLDWPVEVQIPVLGLLLGYAAYAIFRLPGVLGDLRGGSARWHRIRQQRADLERLVAERRRDQSIASEPDGGTSPSAKEP